MSSFKKLIVWQKSMVLVDEVYGITKHLGKEETYGLISQMRRCAVSIPSNIAEGSGRTSRKDYALFLRNALGSSYELETQLLIANSNFNGIETKRADELLLEIQKMLTTIIKKLSV